MIVPDYPVTVDYEIKGKPLTPPPKTSDVSAMIQTVCDAVLQQEKVKGLIVEKSPKGEFSIPLAGRWGFPSSPNSVANYVLSVQPYYNGVNKTRVVWFPEIRKFEASFPVLINDKKFVMKLMGIENPLFKKK